MAHFAGLAASESDAVERDRLYAEATTNSNKADTIDGMHPLTLVGKGAVALAKNDLNRASQAFGVVVSQSKKATSVPALLGLACVAFLRSQFHDALKGYRKALEANPAAPANVRLGLALSFHSLNRIDAARAAFERVLQLDPQNADALVGLAVLKLNSANAPGAGASAADPQLAEERIRDAMSLVKRAYAANPRSAAVLIQLANHFFYRQEYSKTIALATKALQATQAPRARSEACYHVARAHHAQGEFDKAFQYYQQAVKHHAEHPLALYGLGQAHLQRNEDDAALSCFKKVLAANADNWEAMFMVGSLLANKRDKLDEARELLHRVSDLRPNDAQVWLRYAQHLELLNDHAAALSAYRKSAALLVQAGEAVPAEVHNNIAVLASMQSAHEHACRHALLAVGALAEPGAAPAADDAVARRARAYFVALVAETRASADSLVAEIDAAVQTKRLARRVEKAPDAAAADPSADANDAPVADAADASTPSGVEAAAASAQRTLSLLRANDRRVNADAAAAAATTTTTTTAPLNGSLVTALYNFARTSEAAGQLRDAADGYLALLAHHKHYIDARVRLGIMARDAGELDHADAWWESVHKSAKNHAETRCLQGNLHLQRGALLPAQKAFEKIIDTGDKDDAYASLALGNIYYIAHFDKRDEGRSVRQLEHAWQFYWAVLQRDPRNACAANGVALVLAEKQYFAEARTFFHQVREAVSDNASVWINLGHLQMRQGQFLAAAKTYQIVSQKFYDNRDAQVLLWIARAYFEDNKFGQAKHVLQSALHVAPGDPVLRFNWALSLESHSIASVKGDALKSLQDARDALSELDTARGEFESLAQRRGAQTTSVGSVSGVNAARTTAMIAKSAARHEKYCATTRVDLAHTVDKAERAEVERLRKLDEQRQRQQELAAQRAKEEADKIAAVQEAHLAEQRAIEEQEQKLAQLRDGWQSEEAKKQAKAAPKRKRKGRSDEVDPLDEVDDAPDGGNARDDGKEYVPGDTLAPEGDVAPELPADGDEEEEESFHSEDDDDEDDGGNGGDDGGDAAAASSGGGGKKEKRDRKKKLRTLSKKKRASRKTATAAAEHKAMSAVVDDTDAKPRRRLKRRKEGDESDDASGGDDDAAAAAEPPVPIDE
jgi:tetratricopeptide (TPR) repeat protein